VTGVLKVKKLVGVRRADGAGYLHQNVRQSRCAAGSSVVKLGGDVFDFLRLVLMLAIFLVPSP
jgi:hypothetical protein